jgi:hypothetical protein
MPAIRHLLAWLIGLAVFGAIALFASRIGGTVAGKASGAIS